MAGWLQEARCWIADCDWADDDLDPWGLSDEEVRAGVGRHYVGGWAGFVADCC